MQKIFVTKNRSLEGSVKTGGAKNAALPIIAASLLGSEDIVLTDVPDLADVKMMAEVLRHIGAKVELDKNTLYINARELTSHETSVELMQKMRASFLVMGPLLARMGKAVNSLPGGCNIGTRPIDLHLKGFKALGAKIEKSHGDFLASCDRLKGDRVYLDFPSVGATENIIMAATLADGETVIENAAMEPEIVDLSNFLRKMGAKITGAGTPVIKIKGVDRLSGCEHQIIPDRIEAGTFMVASAITGGDVEVQRVISAHMKPIIAKLKEAGCEVIENGENIRVKGGELKPIDIKTLPHPGFPTDMQAQFMALMTQCRGNSTVIESVFENRFMHAQELIKMGADIRVMDREAIVSGGSQLTGAKVFATDLRAGAALILAGLVAEGVTEIGDIFHIDRGYENIEEKFRNLGADVVRKEV